MVYMVITEDSNEKLCLKRSPDAWSWSILIGAVALGFGAAYYGSDYLLWKFLYVSSAIYVGVICMADWEECELNKSTNEVRLRRYSLLQTLFPLGSKYQEVVTNLNEVIGVRVGEKTVPIFGKSYRVVLLLDTGMSVGMTECFTYSDSSDHCQIAERVRDFLQLSGPQYDPLEQEEEEEDSQDEEEEDSSDSFEEIHYNDIGAEEKDIGVVDD